MTKEEVDCLIHDFRFFYPDGHYRSSVHRLRWDVEFIGLGFVWLIRTVLGTVGSLNYIPSENVLVLRRHDNVLFFRVAGTEAMISHEDMFMATKQIGDPMTALVKHLLSL